MTTNILPSIFEESPLGFVHLEIIHNEQNKPTDYRFIGLNPAFEKISGLKKENLTDRPVIQLLPETECTASSWQNLYKRVVAGSGTTVFKHFLAETGRWYIVNAWYTDETHLAITLSDITSDRQLLESGFQKDEQQQALWDNNLFGVIIADKNGNYVDANVEACRMTGYSCEELKSMNVLSLINPEQTNDASAHFEQIAKTGKSYGEVAYHTKSGEKRWWNVVATRLSDDYFLGLHEDITNRKLAEQQLKEEKGHHANVISNISDVLWEYEVDANGQFVRSYISPVADALLNLPAETTGNDFEKYFTFVHPDDRRVVQNTLSTSMFSDEQKIHRLEYRVITNDGNIKHVRSSGILHIKPNGNHHAYGMTSDITELKQKEEELKEKELKFRTLFENSSDAIFIMKGDTFIECNSATLEVYGCQSPGQILGKTPFDFSPALQPNGRNSHEYALDIIEAAVGGTTQFFEWTHTKLDGTPFTAEVKLNQLELNGQILLQAIVRDITERKQAEESLKKSETEYRNLFENANDAIFIMDPETEIILDANNKSCEIYGFKKDEFIGISLKNLSIDVQAGEEKIEHTLKNGQFINFETHQINKRGEVIDFLVNASVIDYRGSKAILSINRNITGRKQAEGEIRKLSQAVEQSPASVIITNMDGVIEYVNPKFTEITGYNIEEAREQNYNAFKTEEMPESTHKEIWETINAGKEWKGEFQNKKKNGELYWEAVSISPIYNDMGNITHFLEVKEDITQRKSTELEMERNRAELRAIYDNAPVMMAVIDENRNLLFANPAFTAFTGVPEAELKGGRACGVFGCINALEHPKGCGFGDKCKSCNLLRAIDDSFLIGSSHKNIEYNTTLVRDNIEKEISLLGSVAPIHFSGKRLLLLNFVDISGRKQTEEALRQVSARLSLATKAGGVGVWDWDCVANSLIWDDQMYALYGISRNTFGGSFESWRSVLHPEDAERTNHEISQALSSLSDFNTEFRVIWPDGSVHYIRALAMVVRDLDGSPIRMIGTNWDITKRMQAEEALQTSDDIVRTIPSGLFIYQFDPPDHLYLLTGNPAAEQLTGLQVADWVGREFNELWPQARQAGLTSEYLKVIETGKPFITEDLFYHDNRLSRAFRIRAFKLAGERLALAFENITEQKQAEEELNASEKKFRELSTLMRLMTDNMPDMLWAKNLNKEFMFANKAICNNLLGAVDTEEPLGKNDMFFAMRERNSKPENPDWHTFGEICRDSDAITLEELKPMQFDEFGNVKGKFLFLDVHKAPLYDEQGQLIGVVGSARDITERKALEEKLIQQTRLRELLMEISSGFINIPLDKVEESINEALFKMGQFVNADRSYTFDYDWENEVCNNTYEWCNEGVNKEINNLQNLPLSIMMDTVVEHKKGRTVYIPDVNIMPAGIAKDFIQAQGVLSFIMVPMMNQKECIGFVGFDSVKGQKEYFSTEVQLLEVFAQLLANVKLRQAMEEQLVDAKLLAEESDRLKSAFLANMSHEIRTPMNGILGFADLLKEPELTGEEKQKYITMINKSGQRMLNIINDIVDISKIEAGLMDVQLTESNINDQIEFIHNFFKPEASSKGLEFIVKNRLAPKDATTQTDREKLYAILTNLVKNAIKYTPAGRLEIGCMRKGNSIEFYVKDTGIGIPKDRQQAVFERFVQADIEDKMAREGAGLGLAITKAYVEMLGGSIWVESEMGIGSVFYFTLPFAAKQDEKPDIYANAAAQETVTSPSPFKILIVEDDNVSEMLLEIELKKTGHKPLKAFTGMEAVEIIRNNRDIDLILMDIRLPGINGYEATRQIRQFNKEVIIIAQTAYGLTGDREKAIEAGCNDYIAKPIMMAELRTLLQKYF